MTMRLLKVDADVFRYEGIECGLDVGLTECGLDVGLTECGEGGGSGGDEGHARI